jgi:hypothetical protein
MTTGQQLKVAGQMASLFDVTDTTRQDFEAILRTVPWEFSINDCREAMDAAGIPDSKRGGLFNAAVKAGLIAAQFAGQYPCTVASTGPSAHAARVKVYHRHNYGSAVA